MEDQRDYAEEAFNKTILDTGDGEIDLPHPPEKPNYVQQSRNGYGCIDFYKGDICVRLIMAGLTKKDSILLTGALNSAIEEGRTYESQLLKWEAEQKARS